ncbi:MAG: adenylate/guanylate cyclase domain-containing response regulator, partial [Pirellula sp.]|nr:adenylate/guanylate cyclase domain-containing response regulator [Pirellula sp.]
NGANERMHGTLYTILRASTSKDGKDWKRQLPMAMFVYRNMIHKSTGLSPHQALYGYTSRHECLDEELLETLRKLDQDLSRARTRFATGPGPRSGESLEHWGVNRITSLGVDCEGINAMNAGNAPAISRLIDKVQNHLRSIYSILTSEDTAESSNHTATISEPSDKLGSSAVDRPSISRPSISRPTITAETSPSGSNEAKLLIVDDDGEIRLSMERMLLRLGHEAYSCGDGYQALKMLQSQSFDVCLLDLHMPGLGGLELISQIRKTPSLSQLPIIVISGSGQIEAAAEAIEMGADDYLTKPPHFPLLKARINACLKQLDLRRAELAKFLPQSVIKASLNNPEKMYSGRLADVSVLFADIRNFSRISDRIGAQETIRWIREVMDRLSSCILSHDGTLVDYVGDEIIAMWGAPQESESHARQACQCALAIEIESERLSHQWRDRLGEPFQLGIGVHSGPAVVGNMASQHRFKYGPFGPTVNVASRVQGATKYLRTNVLITSAVAQMIPADLAKRRLCKVQVKNIPTPLDLYELRQSRALNDERDVSYEDALRAFEERDFVTTTRRLAKLLEQYPEDGPTQLLMNRLIQCRLENEDFSPVWVLPGK